ncbi:peptidylprolyl isomerase [Mariniblastus fucicola]|nr:peptidylprolyl isomerase [Mariniblastus fucicola]
MLASPAHTRSALLTLASVVAICVLGAPGFADAQQRNEATQSPRVQTLAVVNGSSISRQEVANECMRRFGNEVLESLINKMLVFDECQRLGVTITEKDVNDDLSAKAKQLGWTTERYVKFLCEEKGISVDRLKRDILWSELALRRLAESQTQVSPQEVSERLEFEFGPKVQVRQLVVASRTEAEQLRTAAEADPASFEKICKQHSIDRNSASLGGLLPPVRLNSGFPEFENMAFSLEPGQLSPPFPVEDQFVVMKCIRKIPAEELAEGDISTASERIKSEIAREKLRGAALKMFERMQANAKIVNVMNDPQLRRQNPGVAATVNGKPVQLKMVSEESIVRFGKKMLAVLIRNRLLEQSLQAAGKTLDEEQTRQLIDEEIARVAVERGFVAQGQPQVQPFLEFMTRNDASKVEFYIEDEVWPSIALQELVRDNVEVTEEDIQKSFDANYGPRVEVRAIMFSDHRSASNIWKMATANPTEEFFGQLANQYSIEPMSKNNFGHIPPVQKYSGRPTLEQEAFSLQPGEISKVIQLGDYWTFLYCRGRTQPKVTDIEDVREYILRDVRTRKLFVEMEFARQKIFKESQIDNYLTGTSQPGEAYIRQTRESDGGRTQ